MADEDETKLSTSPTEDFDPLKDNPSVVDYEADDNMHVPDPHEGDDTDSPSEQLNSVDGDLETYINNSTAEAAFSPPVSQRFLKREKRRDGGTPKAVKDLKNVVPRQRKPRGVVSVIKERYSESNALFSGLSHTDSDADLDVRDMNKENKEKRRKDRDEKQKSLTKTRQHDLYMKRMSEDPTGGTVNSNTAPMEIPTPVVPVLKLEDSGRFLSLGASKPVPLSPIAAEKVTERRQPCVSKQDCDKDRMNFYKTFSVLINMGSHGRKQKEPQDKDRSFFAQRQKSLDEKLYMKFIWVGLQAWLKGILPVDQEKNNDIERQKIPRVLEEVQSFKVQFSAQLCDNSYLSDQEIPDDDEVRMRHNISREQSSADISKTYQSMSLDAEIIRQQQEAVIQVQTLLESLDQCEQLFPTSSAFAQEYPLYREKVFVQRVQALNLWLNVTKDLCHKLNVLGQIFNVHSSGGWPYVDFGVAERRKSDHCIVRSAVQRDSIPEITNTGVDEVDNLDDVYEDEDDDGEDDDDFDADEAGSASSASTEQTTSTSDRKVSFLCDGDRRLSYTSPKRGRSPSYLGSPPDTSTPLRSQFSNNTLSRASSEASIDELARSVYRTYVDKGLKKMGLNKMLVRLRDILYRSLRRARVSLEQINPELLDRQNRSGGEDLHSSPTLDLLDKNSNRLSDIPIENHNPEDLNAWREEFLAIGLPSYRPTYIFLLGVILEVIHEAMKIRLEQLENPIGEPSFLSIRQLIIECKDVLAKAVLVKQDYQCMVQAVLDDEEAKSETSPLDLEAFDNDMSNMFKMYFQYLQSWLLHLQNLPEASRSLKNPLEEEWSFTKKICPHIIGGEAEAGKRFSCMAISLLMSISDFLESGVDECKTSLFDWTTNDLSCSEEGEGESEDERESDTEKRRSKSSNSLKKSFQKTCRNFKNLFHEARERASKALGFAKLLRKDLEIAADFNIAVTMVEFLDKLRDSGHINVIAPLSAGYLMFIPQHIAEQRSQIIQLLNVTCGREDISLNSDVTHKDEGYLLMVRCGGGLDGGNECPLWEGASIQVEPTAETTIALSHIQVDSLLLVVIHSSHLMNQRREFENLMGSTLDLVNDQTSCHQVIAESLVELKEAAISLRDKVATVIRQVEEHWNCDVEMEESEKKHILKLYRETMLQAYNFGFEYMKEVTRLVSGETRHKLGKGLFYFAKDWMKFVSEKCERGRGMRPRWANQGLDFLLVACEPKVLALLTQEEYMDLQESLNEFITHLIGNAEKSGGGPLPMSRSSAGETFTRQYNRYPSWPAPADKMHRSVSAKSVGEGANLPHTAPAALNHMLSNTTRILQSTPSIDSVDSDPGGSRKRVSDGSVDIHDGEDGGLVMEVHRHYSEGSNHPYNVFSYKPLDRVKEAIRKLEGERDGKLRNQKVIGRVTKNREVNYHINTRKVNFHWQKGNKIGEGQFGKVYSAVNMDTGELMAMKEMKFPTADTQYHFKQIIDEIKIFEGINHPNLVRYYGVEVHRTEMLVFMEYCDRGTIEEVSRIGLTEDLIRRYTRELLIAVQQLHENGIVHRDIKGANIFLTSTGCLKLGDFGCSVKLKNHTTMAGEVNSVVGTTAYMAPEVITRTAKEGHGRAADIWSVGCVVIEMTSGKRPWHEFESQYQIMYQVGTGRTPPIPENLGDEGRDFLCHCFEQDPEARWMATQLRDHPFAKIYEESDGSES